MSTLSPTLALVVVGLIGAAPALGRSATRAIEGVNVPYVGCASDGQQGRQPPPKQSKPTPRLPPVTANRLAYYAAVNNGVLAPRGWHCFSLYGSSGTSVYVTPEPIDGRRLIGNDKPRFKGDGVEFSYTFGGTSGRFEVAKVSSKYFPIAHAFVTSVANEQKEIGIPFDLSGNAFRDDRIVGRTDTVVRFTTPARKQGLGAYERLAPNNSPIEGLAALIPDGGEPDLLIVNARLPLKERDLVSVIQSVAEANRGDPLSNTPLQDPSNPDAAVRRRPR